MRGMAQHIAVGITSVLRRYCVGALRGGAPC